MARNARNPTPQAMEPMNGWFEESAFDEISHQSPAFDTTYNGVWHANIQFSGQIDPTFVNYSHNNPPSMQTAGQFTEAFVDPSLNNPTHMHTAGQFTEAFVDQIPNIPTHMQPAGQSTLTSLDQSRNTPTNIQDFGQSTRSATSQNDNVSMNLQPLGQHTQTPIKDDGNTTTNVLLDEQAAQAPFHYSGSPCTNIPQVEQATPAPAHFGANGNKKTKATGKSSPASTKGRTKNPAAVEDKNIERCASEYNISYNNIRILMDYANARLKGIETSEPKDAPSRYIISRFEQVRRTHPEHATWPYDIPEEKIIRLLPGQKRQDRAPIKCHYSACEERRQGLDARYHESRQWNDPPPPRPHQTEQDKLTAPGIDDSPTGLTPSPLGNSNAAEAAEPSTIVQHNSLNSLDMIIPLAVAYDFQIDDNEGGVQPPSPPSTTTPNQPDNLDTRNYLVDGRAASGDIHMAGPEELDQLPSPLPTSTPTEQGNINLSDNSNLLAESDDSQYEDLYKQIIDDSELDEYFDEPAQCPPKHGTPWPFHQGQPKEEHPFVLPHLDSWPDFAPIICHPLVRALELHTGRKDPSRHKEFKGYTIPVANYKARVTQTPAPADSGSTPEAQFMPQGYQMTEELRREIEQRIGIHMKLRWGRDADNDDDGKKARSGELVKEDLRRLEDENPGWRYRMAYWIGEWGLGGVQGSELSEGYFIEMLCEGCWRGCLSIGKDPIAKGY